MGCMGRASGKWLALLKLVRPTLRSFKGACELQRCECAKIKRGSIDIPPLLFKTSLSFITYILRYALSDKLFNKRCQS
jgi:hypothetical protein